MDDDTAIGKDKGAAFPATPASAVLGVQNDDPVSRARAFTAIARAYWKPVYKRVRLRFRKSNEEAKDLTQAFFTRALERGVFAAYEPSEARFRTFVRKCLDNFVLNEEEARLAIKRGGGAIALRLDFDEAEAELTRLGHVEDAMHERVFDEDWVKSLLAISVDALREQLRREGKESLLRAFERYDLVDEGERPTYADLAAQLGLKTTDVTNQLHAARQRLRAVLLVKLRELTLTDEEFRSEALSLFGVEPPSRSS